MSLDNIPTITPGMIPLVLHEAWKMKRSIMLWGEVGVGKSESVKWSAEHIKNAAQLKSFGVLDRRLSQYEPVELRGIPRVITARDIYRDLEFVKDTVLNCDAEEKACPCPDTLKTINDRIAVLRDNPPLHAMSEWSMPDVLPRIERDGKNGILFLDELSNAPLDVQAAAFELILDRRVGDHKLPDGWVVVGAGNSLDDSSTVFEMAPPLANRLVHMRVDHSFEDWLNWAYRTNQNPNVIGFHQYYGGSKLFSRNSKVEDRAFATPRSWSYVAQAIDTIETESILSAFVCGAVGIGLGAEFMFFLHVQQSLPDVDEILSEWKKGNRYKFPNIGDVFESKDISTDLADDEGNVTRRSYSISGASLLLVLISSIAARTSVDTASTIIDIAEALHEQKNSEYATVLIRDAMRKDKKAIMSSSCVNKVLAWASKQSGVMRYAP